MYIISFTCLNNFSLVNPVFFFHTIHYTFRTQHNKRTNHVIRSAAFHSHFGPISKIKEKRLDPLALIVMQ